MNSLALARRFGRTRHAGTAARTRLRMLSTGAMLSLSTAGASVGGVQDPGSLARAETAFAETMRARDFQRFAAFIADDAVFINGGKPLRGKPAILAHWQGMFKGAQAPFSWRPELAELTDGGRLGYTEGPVMDPAGKPIARFYSVWKRQADGQWRVVFDNGYDLCDCKR